MSAENVKTIEAWVVSNLEVTSFNSFRDIPKNNLVTTAADIDDSIKRKLIRISLKNLDSVAFRLVLFSTVYCVADMADSR